MYECFCSCSVYLAFVFSVVNMGRWSEPNVCFVCQVVLLLSDVDMDVMSGDVACWCVVLGTLVGVLVFSG